MRVIDADGHIIETPYLAEIAKFMPAGQTNIFPALDHLHGQHFRKSLRSGPRVGPDGPSVRSVDVTVFDFSRG